MDGLDISIAIRVGPDSRISGPIVLLDIISETGIQMVDEINSNNLVSE